LSRSIPSRGQDRPLLGVERMLRVYFLQWKMRAGIEKEVLGGNELL
jgi:hypothetical protein